MAAPLLTLSGICLSIGGDVIFDSAAISIVSGARIALVGRNGSGKSTLMKIMAGSVEADKGRRFVHPGATVRYLVQEPDARGFVTIGDYACAGLDETGERHQAEALLIELGLDPASPTRSLSGGELRRAALVQVLAAAPDILLLDEPTNHLDLPAITWLEEKLRGLSAAVVLISHDRRFLEKITNETVWIDRGATRTTGQGFKRFEEWRDKFLEEEATALHKLGRKIAAEEDWMRYGVTARRKRNMRRVGELKAMRKELRETRRVQNAPAFSVQIGAASGKRAIVAENISKSFSGRKIIDGFSIEIARGDRIGLVGPNGAGKTTLVNMLTGALSPDEGTVSLGANLQIETLDQRRARLKPEMRVGDAINDGAGDWVMVNGEKRHVATYLGDFLFGPNQWRQPVNALSGGERGRLALAAVLARASNLLVLDEPTNDLDLETLEMLEEQLSSYEGTLLLISHDRQFLDNLVTSVVTTDPEAPGKWVRYAGGYDDMVAQRGRPPGLAKAIRAEKPKTKPGSTRPAPTSKTKMSYKDQFALEQLPGEIDALHLQIETLKQKLADPALFNRDPGEFEKTAAALSKAEDSLSQKEDLWIELELKREGQEI